MSQTMRTRPGDDFEEDWPMEGEGGDTQILSRKKGIERQRLGKKIVLIAMLALLGIGAVAFGVRALTARQDPVTASTTRDPANISAPPGSPDVTPTQAKEYRDRDAQLRRQAEKSGSSFVKTSVLDGAVESKPIPPQTTVTPSYTPPVTPGTTVRPGGAPPNGSNNGAGGVQHNRAEDMRAAMEKVREKALSDRGMVRLVSTLQNTSGGIQPISPIAQQSNTGFQAINSATGHDDAANANAALVEVLAPPHRAYGATQYGANSDAMATLAIDLLSGPFVGATVYGDPRVQQKTMSMAANRMAWMGMECKVEAVVLNPDGLDPALDAEVENHYLERVVIPAIAGAFSAGGKVASQPSTTININGSTTTSSSASAGTREIIAGAINGGAQAANSVMSADANSIKATVRMRADKPQVVVFTKRVTREDCK